MKQMLKMLEKLLKQGRGFNLQSHGINPAGDDFYNFALYPTSSKGSTYYYHSASLKDIVASLKEFMAEGIAKAEIKPKVVVKEEEEEWPVDFIGSEPIGEEEEETMEDLL